MPKLRVTIVEEIDVPEGAEIVLAPTGVVSGLRLPNGEFIKPWISWELYPSSNADVDALRDLKHDELLHRDIITDLDFERDIDVLDGDVNVDRSQVSQG